MIKSHRILKFVGITFAFALVFAGESSWAAPKNKMSAKKATVQANRAPASANPSKGSIAVTESDKPLKVTGQSRNVNMMLVLKNENEQIKFVKVRKNFQDKVAATHF